MSRGITVTGLSHVSPSAIATIGSDAGKARKHFQDAEDAFGGKVADPICSKRVWSGGGQQDADNVMRINLSALIISHVEMQAAHTTLDTFADAVDKARRKMLSTLDEAERCHVVVCENGTCRTSEMVDEGSAAGVWDDVHRIEREAKGALLFAAIADACCTKLLGRINGHAPQYSNTADPNILAANGQTLGSALYDRQLANANKKFWDAASPQPMPESPGALAKLWHGLGNFASYLWHNPGEAATLASDSADLALDVGLIAVGIEGEEGGFALDATLVGALVGVPVNVASAVLIEQGIVKGVGDASKAGHDASRMYSEAQSQGGSPGTSGSATPDSDAIRAKAAEKAGEYNGSQVNYGLGKAGTRADADKLGKEFVGPGYRVASDGRTLVSADGTRVYRPPALKKHGVASGQTQANFEVRNPSGAKGKKILSDGHLTVENP